MSQSLKRCVSTGIENTAAAAGEARANRLLHGGSRGSFVVLSTNNTYRNLGESVEFAMRSSRYMLAKQYASTLAARIWSLNGMARESVKCMVDDVRIKPRGCRAEAPLPVRGLPARVPRLHHSALVYRFLNLRFRSLSGVRSIAVSIHLGRAHEDRRRRVQDWITGDEKKVPARAPRFLRSKEWLAHARQQPLIAANSTLFGVSR